METRTCQNCKKEFRIEPEDFAFYSRIHVPPPTWCPECRMLRRFLWNNDRHLFRRKEDAGGKEIFSSFPQQAPVKVYDLEYWRGDGWDPMSYGSEYDTRRPFFEQFRDLLLNVPLPAKSVVNIINSEYCNKVGDMKNSYLCFNSDYVENSGYVVGCQYTKDSFDLYESQNDELCYDSSQIDECFRAFFSFDCDGSTDVWFSKDLVGCADCFGCVNLRKKSYHIFNRPYSKEAYFEKLKELNLGSHQAVKELAVKAHNFWLNFPVKYFHGYRNIASNGEHVQNAKQVKNSYCIHGGENIAFSQFLEEIVTDCYDYTVWGMVASQMYECLECGMEDSGLKFCWDCWPTSINLEYCISCRSSSDLFGCIGLQKKQYCIFNKQYSEDDYFALRDKIIKHMNEMPYISKPQTPNPKPQTNPNDQNLKFQTKEIIYRYGEFFPPEFSPFAYNETLAQDFFPLPAEAAVKAGYLWREPEAREYQTSVNAADLPDHIKDVQDSVLKEIIKCASCGKAHRIIPMELDFLRRMTLPLPRLCPNCRFLERFKFVNPPKFWHAKCQCAGSADERGIYKNTAPHFHGQDHCPNEFETSYAPERKEIIYCEACYQSEVV